MAVLRYGLMNVAITRVISLYTSVITDARKWCCGPNFSSVRRVSLILYERAALLFVPKTTCLIDLCFTQLYHAQAGTE